MLGDFLGDLLGDLLGCVTSDLLEVTLVSDSYGGERALRMIQLLSLLFHDYYDDDLDEGASEGDAERGTSNNPRGGGEISEDEIEMRSVEGHHLDEGDRDRGIEVTVRLAEINRRDESPR